MQEYYTNYEEPITQMRNLSKLSIPFSFTHKKLDGNSVSIRVAALRPQSLTKQDKNAKYKLQYTNLETDELRSCFIPLLTSFNGKLIKVSQ